MLHCCRTDIPEDELDQIIQSIHAKFAPPPAAVPSAPNKSSGSERSDMAVSALESDKRVRNLRKKLEQIQTLKERQHKGEKLETNQV